MHRGHRGHRNTGLGALCAILIANQARTWLVSVNSLLRYLPLPGLLALIVLSLLGWGAYTLSPLPACRAAAADLEDAKRLNFGEGPSWGISEITNCALLPSVDREKQIAAIQVYKFNAGIFHQELLKNLQR